MDIWVYRYRYWDEDRNENIMSRDYFTIDAIRAGLGIPLIDSGMKVQLRDLDDSGRFRAYTHQAPDTERES